MTAQLDTSNMIIRQAIKALENVDFIPAIAKAHILLVANGDKPSTHTELLIDFSAQSNEPYQSDSSDIDKLFTIVTNLDLHYYTETNEFDSPTYGARVAMAMIFLARQKVTLDQLLDARAKGDEEREGLLLGYPGASVAAFVNDDMIEIADVPESTKQVTPHEMMFLTHRLSKQNWEDEIAYLPKLARTVRRISPRIYSQCISHSMETSW